jgi:hypothetical protein
MLIKTRLYSFTKSSRIASFRRPFPDLSDYVVWLSVSGFGGSKEVPREGVFKSIGFIGANMGFRRKAIVDCPIAMLYRRSRKDFSFEWILAYHAKRKGFNSYGV